MLRQLLAPHRLISVLMPVCLLQSTSLSPSLQSLLTIYISLLQTATDHQLEQAVTASFSQFGTVYVKIRRDGRGMPFAFAQYEVLNS